MRCEECHVNQATLHVKKLVNNTFQIMHLCEDCATFSSLNDKPVEGLNIGDLITQMEAGLPETDAENVSPLASICKKCGMSLDDFRNSGRFGCEECYRRFDSALRPGLTKMHRGTQHTGKVPTPHGAQPPAQQNRPCHMSQLREELARAVAAEEYETAAVLRDEISHLQEPPADRSSK